MRLTSQNNAFVFSFPRDAITKKVMDMYKTFIDRSHVQYDDVLDYLNSTIKSITFPGMSFDTPEQIIYHGKSIKYKSSKNIQDTLNKDITITFKTVDAHTNYFMIQHLVADNYLDIGEKPYDQTKIFCPPFILCILDWNRDGIYYLKFDKIVYTGLSDFTFDYGDSLIEEKTFTMTFTFNFYELEYILTGDRVFRTDDLSKNLEFNSSLNNGKSFEEYRNSLRNNNIPK
jgi:hypothetical protein